jgi:putative membrane protein
MTWWCTATREPWDWAPRAYPGIWLAMAALLGAYLVAYRRRPVAAGTPAGLDAGGAGRTGDAGDRRELAAFVAGWAALWLATDWPIGTLGAGYLASAHMGQYLLTTLVAAPLLVLGTPERVARRLMARTRTEGLVRVVCRPLAAGIVVNVVLVVTHAPVTVDALRSNQLGSFALDLAWLVGGIVLWVPVCGPLAELRPGYAARGVYLFLAAGLVPMIPGGFLTFASTPLYATYELAPRVGGFDAVDDQQLAGALMKVGNLPLIWPVLAGLFLRWANDAGRPGAQSSPAGSSCSTVSTGANRSPWPATRSSTSAASNERGSPPAAALTSSQVTGVETVGRARARSE